ncbi:MAG TPA: potassium/proton antiporter [Capillimicrobium sp.]|nr:potassium/proton antiporter [Capillimicrobium sp.]
MLIAGLLMAAALAGSLLAGRLRVPGLLLFLAIGMVIGSDGLGLLDFSDYEMARNVGIVALAVIIYEGGLSTRASDLRPVFGAALSLSVLATILTALIAGAAAHLLFDLTLLEGLLLGSIIASTDAAAVFAMLRDSALRPRLARLLEGEAASNDPVAVLLVLGFIEWITLPDYGVVDMGVLFVRQIAIGVAAGVAIGWLGSRVLRAVQLATPGLYPVASLTIGAVAFGSADALGGSGFLAVYLAGLVLGSTDIPARRTIGAFHSGLAWLAQLSMFLTLGLLVFPSQLWGIAGQGILLAAVLIVVARPVASTVSTLLSRFSLAERGLLAWVGLRGAVPVVLATFPVTAGVEHSLDFFNIVFFAVIASLLIQGPMIEPLARRLGLTTDDPPVSDPLVEVATLRRLGADVVEYVVREDDAIAGAPVRDLALPREAVVNVIVRGDAALPPRGSTILRPGDALHVLVRREVADEVAGLLRRWREGPIGPPPRPRPALHGRAPLFSSGPAAALLEGPPERPHRVGRQEVVERLRVRRDEPGALVVLDDGRYAITGPQVAIGGREDLARYARRRLREAEGAERPWLRNVVAALAADPGADRAPSPGAG